MRDTIAATLHAEHCAWHAPFAACLPDDLVRLWTTPWDALGEADKQWYREVAGRILQAARLPGGTGFVEERG